ncbi:MAG TPA: hypothetical protein PLW63_08210, partial [Bacillota bacterium]|nr:hypothetical protein [Bacillota bacterium]
MEEDRTCTCAAEKGKHGHGSHHHDGHGHDEGSRGQMMVLLGLSLVLFVAGLVMEHVLSDSFAFI